MGAQPPDCEPAGRRRHGGAHGRPLHRGAERLLPGAGHRRDPGHLGSARFDLVSRDGREAAGARQGRPARSRRREPVFVHRRRRDQPHPEQRAHAHQFETARGAQAQRHRGDPPAAGRVAGGPGHHAVSAAGAGPHRRGSSQPHAVPVHPRGPQRGRARHLDGEVHRSAQAIARAQRRRKRSADPGPADLARHRPCHRIAPRDHSLRDRQCAVRRVRPAPGLDAVHAAQPVPCGAGGRASLPERARQAAGHLSAELDRTGPAERDHPSGNGDGAARHQPPGSVPGLDHLLQRGVFFVPRRRHRRGRTRAARSRHAEVRPARVPGDR